MIDTTNQQQDKSLKSKGGKPITRIPEQLIYTVALITFMAIWILLAYMNDNLFIKEALTSGLVITCLLILKLANNSRLEKGVQKS